MTAHQFLIKQGDASTENADDLLVTVYGGKDLHVVACQRDPLNHSRWQPPLPVHALDGCGCGHRHTDHRNADLYLGPCDLCDCKQYGGVR